MLISQVQASPLRLALPLKYEGLGTLERLPAELIQQAVGYVAQDPRALAGFAVTSHLATEFANQSLRALVPPQHRTTRNRFLEWQAQYRALEPSIQCMLDATADYLPCPDIFSPLDDNIEACHWALFQVRIYADKGCAFEMEMALDNLKRNVAKVNMPIQDVRGILLQGYEKAISKDFSSACNHARNGHVGDMNIAFSAIMLSAQKAGLPAPNFDHVRHEGYRRALSLALAHAREAAALGKALPMKQHIAAAQSFADVIGTVLPRVEELRIKFLFRQALSGQSRHRNYGHTMHDRGRRGSPTNAL